MVNPFISFTSWSELAILFLWYLAYGRHTIILKCPTLQESEAVEAIPDRNKRK